MQTDLHAYLQHLWFWLCRCQRLGCRSSHRKRGRILIRCKSLSTGSQSPGFRGWGSIWFSGRRLGRFSRRGIDPALSGPWCRLSWKMPPHLRRWPCQHCTGMHQSKGHSIHARRSDQAHRPYHWREHSPHSSARQGSTWRWKWRLQARWIQAWCTWQGIQTMINLVSCEKAALTQYERQSFFVAAAVQPKAAVKNNIIAANINTYETFLFISRSVSSVQ